MWKYYALLSALFAGITAVLAKVGLRGISGNLATAIRTIVIVFMAWGIVAFTGEWKSVKQLDRHNLLFLVLSGITTGLSWLFYFKALEGGPVSKVAPIDKLSLVVAVILAFLVLKETPDWKVISGVLLITGGTLLLIR